MRKILRKNLNKKLRKARSRRNISGTLSEPRLSVFRSNKYIHVQLIDDAAGHTIASVSSLTLKDKKLNKTAAAKAVGVEIAESAKKLGIKKIMFHRGPYQYAGRIKAVAEGIREAGLKI
jgi:large subunit ribosomal protein L18